MGARVIYAVTFFLHLLNAVFLLLCVLLLEESVRPEPPHHTHPTPKQQAKQDRRIYTV